MTTSIPSKTTVSYDSVKLGIDAHAKYYWVSRQLDGATPQPVQKMTYDELLLFVVKQQKLTPNLVTCYEAGETRRGQALGYSCLLDRLFSNRGGSGKQCANKRFHG